MPFKDDVKSKLDRCIPNKELLQQEIAAWEKRRNELACKMDSLPQMLALN